MCLFNFLYIHVQTQYYRCLTGTRPQTCVHDNWLLAHYKSNSNTTRIEIQVGGKYSSPTHKVLGQGVLMWPTMKMGFVVFSDGRLWDIAAAFYLNRKYEIDFSYMSINEYYTLTIVNLNLRYSNLPVGSLPLWQAFIHICSPVIYSKMLLFIQSLWFSVQLPLQTNDLGNNWDYSEEN